MGTESKLSSAAPTSAPGPVVVHANLDAEATWAGIVLPRRIRERLAATAALLAALAPAGASTEVWAPAPVDPARLRGAPGWSPPILRVGAPPRADLAWAAAGARVANDRRLSLALALELGVALPGVRVIASRAELAAHLLAGGAAASHDDHWVCKAPFTAAGRDRAHGQHAPTGELAARIDNLLARHGELVFEPWLARVADAGVCLSIAADGRVTVAPPHGLLTTPTGGFLGIDTGADGLLPGERHQLVTVAFAVAARVAATGYRGPLGLDAFAYTRADGTRAFHPLCELNARFTFGAVARALAARLGPTARVLGFGSPPPGAVILVAPAADPFCAWVAGHPRVDPSG